MIFVSSQCLSTDHCCSKTKQIFVHLAFKNAKHKLKKSFHLLQLTWRTYPRMQSCSVQSRALRIWMTSSCLRTEKRRSRRILRRMGMAWVPYSIRLQISNTTLECTISTWLLWYMWCTFSLLRAKIHTGDIELLHASTIEK